MPPDPPPPPRPSPLLLPTEGDLTDLFPAREAIKIDFLHTTTYTCMYSVAFIWDSPAAFVRYREAVLWRASMML